MMGSEHKVTVSLLCASHKEAEEKANLLADIGQYIDLDNLKTLAKAAKKTGINSKIKQYAIFL